MRFYLEVHDSILQVNDKTALSFSDSLDSQEINFFWDWVVVTVPVIRMNKLPVSQFASVSVIFGLKIPENFKLSHNFDYLFLIHRLDLLFLKLGQCFIPVRFLIDEVSVFHLLSLVIFLLTQF